MNPVDAKDLSILVIVITKIIEIVIAIMIIIVCVLVIDDQVIVSDITDKPSKVIVTGRARRNSSER